MRSFWVAGAVLAIACGSVKDRKTCASSVECPVGQWCAPADGERRCWPDATPPTATVSAVSCTAAPCPAGTGTGCEAVPCVRDGFLQVAASAADDEEVLDASVALDLLPARTFPMARSGQQWIASVPIRELPFPAFDRGVVATVVARDGARNQSAPAASAPVPVTRLKWVRDVETGTIVGLTSPAVRPDGAALLGGTTGKLYVVTADATTVTSIAVGSGQITAAPAVGRDAIWVGSSDGSLYAVKLDGSAVLSGVGIASGGAISGSVAVAEQVGKEWGFATSRSGRVVAASTVPGEKDSTAATDSFTAGPVLDSSGRVFAATDVLAAAMRCYTFDGAFSDNGCAVAGNPPLGNSVLSPLAVDGEGGAWTVSLDGKISRTVSSGATTTIVPGVGANVPDALVIASGGDVLVGDQSGLLHRYTSAGAPVWTTAFNLGGAVMSPMIVTQGDADLLVPTKGGALFAIRADGTKVWDGVLGATELRAGNIYTPPGQTAPVLSLAYYAGANGKLYAVVVDGRLDTGAPWPKAFHDPRNTSSAVTQP